MNVCGQTSDLRERVMGKIGWEEVRDDAGISIIEALISCVLIGLIAATAVPAFIGFYGGIKETKTENNAMNLGQAMLLEASSYERLPQGSNKCVPLLNGRVAGDVSKTSQHWIDGTNLTDVKLDDLVPAYNPDPVKCPGTAVPVYGVTRNVGSSGAAGYKLGNVYYKVQTWIGKCYSLAGSPGVCDPSYDPAAPSNAGKIHHESYRVTTRVTWSGGGCSKSTECSYTNAVMLEADQDQVFYEYTKNAPDVTRALRSMCVVKNTSALVDFLSNIQANFSGRPVEILQRPSKGYLSTDQDIKLGRAVYRPNRNTTGADTIRYRVQNSVGTWSEGVELQIMVKETCI